MIIQLRNRSFINWLEYFNWLLTKDGQFEKSKTDKINQTYIEEYRYKNSERKTKIIVAYLDDFDRLIFYNIVDPLTVGYTEFQNSDIQYFEQGQFDNPPKRGKPGLIFNLINLKAIDNEFSSGLKGQEIQYLKDGKIIKSKIKFSNGGDSLTYRFDNKGLLTRLMEKMKGKNENVDFEKRVIELNEIFEGIK